MRAQGYVVVGDKMYEPGEELPKDVERDGSTTEAEETAPADSEDEEKPAARGRAK